MQIDVTILDRIAQQADEFDDQNINYEQEIIRLALKAFDDVADSILDNIYTRKEYSSMTSIVLLQTAMSARISKFADSLAHKLSRELGIYADKGYQNTGELIAMGDELNSRPHLDMIKEMKNDKRVDPSAIEFLKNHAFEQVTNISTQTVQAMKSELGILYAGKVYDRTKIENRLMDIMDTNRKRIEMIVQTELSMGYNYGALERLDYANKNGANLKKYWYGFSGSKQTCPLCNAHIGQYYDIDDNTVNLPAHPRCRCVWLPYGKGWEEPIEKMFMSNYSMITRSYTPQAVYDKINKRLNIDYAQFLNPEDANKFLAGDRTEDIVTRLSKARVDAVKYKVDSFAIAKEDATTRMGNEFNTQINFWKKYVAQQMIDQDFSNLRNAREAIKGITILPWSGEQLAKFSKLIDNIDQTLIDYVQH